jgi:HSP20 family protein
MTIFDDEFSKIFRQMSNSFFNPEDILEEFKIKGANAGPYFYGYTMTVGPNGKPIVKEYGNVKPELFSASNSREPLVDTIVDQKENLVKLVAEMPGVEKTDVKIQVESKSVNISAERGEKKYHVNVPISQKIDENSAKASYKNGILELIFKLAEEEKPKSKTVEVE